MKKTCCRASQAFKQLPELVDFEIRPGQIEQCPAAVEMGVGHHDYPERVFRSEPLAQGLDAGLDGLARGRSLVLAVGWGFFTLALAAGPHEHLVGRKPAVLGEAVAKPLEHGGKKSPHVRRPPDAHRKPWRDGCRPPRRSWGRPSGMLGSGPFDSCPCLCEGAT